MPDPTKPSEDAGTGTLKGTRPAAAAGDQAPKSPEKGTATPEPEKLDDPEPNEELRNMKEQRALADATKSIEPAAEAILSGDADKDKARTAIVEAYRKVARTGPNRESEGELRARYGRVNDKFVDAAADMLRSREGGVRRPNEEKASHLAVWIKAHLTGDGDVRKVLLQRQQVAARMEARLGEREKQRDKAAAKTRQWEQAFARWSDPGKEIAALIASYEGRIDQLNAEINTGSNRDQAIFSFWFEVAPVHLQLRADKVDDDNAPGVRRIREALQGLDKDLLNNFESGEDRKDVEDRKDGSIYLIDPDKLANKRSEILKSWQDAAIEQAKAEADYTTRPDAAADLKPRHDKLKGDGWVKGTRDILAKPKA